MDTGSYENRTWARTRPGLGPQVSPATIRARQHSQCLRDALDRYAWFARQVQGRLGQTSIDDWIDALFNGRDPGAVELAMVALSLSEQPLATIALLEYRAPSNKPALGRLHRVCIARSKSR